MNKSTLNLSWENSFPTKDGKSIRHCYKVSGSADALTALSAYVDNYDDSAFACPFMETSDGWLYFRNDKADSATLTYNGTYYVWKPVDPAIAKAEKQAEQLLNLMAKHPTIPADVLLKIIQGA